MYCTIHVLIVNDVCVYCIYVIYVAGAFTAGFVFLLLECSHGQGIIVNVHIYSSVRQAGTSLQMCMSFVNCNDHMYIVHKRLDVASSE